MNNSLLKMLAPQVIKLASKPEVKAKLIELTERKKYEALERFAEEEGLTVEDLSCSDVVLQCTQNADDLIVRIMLVERGSGCPQACLAVYRWEDLVDGLKKLL